MATSAALMSLAEFERLPDNGLRHELSEGQLIEMTQPKWLHTRLAHRIFELLFSYLSNEDAVRVLLEAPYKLSDDPPTIRVPDVSIVDGALTRSTGKDDWMAGAPLLAIEVVSPSDTASQLNAKTAQYLRYGSKAVWVIYPDTQQVHVHRSGEPTEVLESGGVLTASDVSMTLRLEVSEVFLPVS